MSKQTEALKLALDCVSTLANARDWVGCTPNERWDEDEMYEELCNATICLKKSLSIIQEALAEQPAQQQEPSTYLRELSAKYIAEDEASVSSINRLMTLGRKMADCIAASPPAAQQQEPVAWMDGYRNIYSLEEKAAGCPEATIALVPMANHKKTSGSPINELQCVCGAVWLGEEMVHLPDKRPPASKPWAGLTDVEWQEIDASLNGKRDLARIFVRAIEAKLKEKNA